MRAIFLQLFFSLTVTCFAQQSVDSFSNLKVLNMNQDTVDLVIGKKPSIILLASENTCSRCYETLETALNSRNSIDRINLILILRLPHCVPCRKDFVKRYRIFKHCDSVYYDVHGHQGNFITDKCKDGLFGKLKVCRTPAVIMILPNKIIVYNHEDIFNGLEVSQQFIKDYNDFLKQIE